MEIHETINSNSNRGMSLICFNGFPLSITILYEMLFTRASFFPWSFIPFSFLFLFLSFSLFFSFSILLFCLLFPFPFAISIQLSTFCQTDSTYISANVGRHRQNRKVVFYNDWGGTTGGVDGAFDLTFDWGEQHECFLSEVRNS